MQALDVIRDLKGIDTPLQFLPGGAMHSYILPGAAWEAPAQRGAVRDSVPFTHPAHVPPVLELLRHQCLINTLLRSCITSQHATPGRRSFTLQHHRQYGDVFFVFVFQLCNGCIDKSCYQVQFVTCTSKSFQSLTPAFL